MSCAIESQKTRAKLFFSQLRYFSPQLSYFFFFFPPVMLFSSVAGGKKEENGVTGGEK
jgi:hypothetical protein